MQITGSFFHIKHHDFNSKTMVEKDYTVQNICLELLEPIPFPLQFNFQIYVFKNITFCCKCIFNTFF